MKNISWFFLLLALDVSASGLEGLSSCISPLYDREELISQEVSSTDGVWKAEERISKDIDHDFERRLVIRQKNKDLLLIRTENSFVLLWRPTIIGDVLVAKECDSHCQRLYFFLPKEEKGKVSCRLLYATPISNLMPEQNPLGDVKVEFHSLSACCVAEFSLKARFGSECVWHGKRFIVPLSITPFARGVEDAKNTAPKAPPCERHPRSSSDCARSRKPPMGGETADENVRREKTSDFVEFHRR